ncbi:MAG: DUF1501 domain-containing protein [Gemmatimonadaceae bacterium]|jgi:uncharacterized protein (DUF1501 family)|nr:DUF1501 domain-containing protein [Gemmatimonadaceae bacterium]
MQRRAFVTGAGLGLVTLGLSPSFLRSAVAQGLPRARRGKVLICLFQRGAADALNVVVPFGDAHYYHARPTLGIAPPIKRLTTAAPQGASVLDLDGFFGLHPALAPLKPLWDRGLLAPVHAVGSPSATRSHFDAQDFLESGTPDRKSTVDGWLNRFLATQGTCEACVPATARVGREVPFRAVAMTQQTPRILEGRATTVAMDSIDGFTLRGGGGDAAARIEALYKTGSADVVTGSGSDMFEALKVLKAANPQQYRPADGVSYPASQFGQRLKQIAQLIKADVGLEVAFADLGGWDTHVNQGGATGQLAARLTDFSSSIAALVRDLGDRMDDVVILTMSEFGRTVRQNGTGGTDHGHATAVFAIGGSVKGGMVHGRWPGLAREQLYEGRDLALTTDFRTVFREVLTAHMGATSLDAVFPGFTGSPRLGVLRG